MKKSIFTRTIWLVSLVSLFNDIASEMLYPIMPVFLKSIGFSIVLIGILEGIAEAVAGISKGYFGNMSDRIGKRTPFIRFGYFLSAISKPLLALWSNAIWIFFARTTDRLGKGIRTSARDALLSDETTKEHKGKVFGFHRAFDTIGAALGPIFALIFLHFNPGNYRMMFILAFIPGFLSISITFLIKEKKKIERVLKAGSVGFFDYLKYWKVSSSSYKYLIAGLLFFTLMNSSDAFLLLRLKEDGYSDTEMIGFYILYNLVYAAFAYPIGYIADKIGLKSTLITGLILFAIVYGFFGFATGTTAFIILFAIYGIYAAATEGVSKALISNISRKEETATAIGFYNSIASICTMLASSFAGLIWYNFGFEVMFMVSAIGVACTSIYLIVIAFRKRSEHSF